MSENLLQSLRARLIQERDPALAAEIQAAVSSRRSELTGHTEWGLLCEEASLFQLAFGEFQLALREQPNDLVAAFRILAFFAGSFSGVFLRPAPNGFHGPFDELVDVTDARNASTSWQLV